jgi:hypothetical protein
MGNSNIVERYIKGLQERLSDDDKLALSYASGATAGQLNRLKNQHPKCPDSLIQLLTRINGTYWQKYRDHEIAVLILGSDVFEHSYYLKSVEQILEKNNHRNSIRGVYGEYMESILELVGAGIDPDITIDR